MVEKLLLIMNRLDRLIKVEDNWYNSRTKAARNIKILFAFCVLILFVAIAATFFTLIFLYLPRLSAYIILTCMGVPLIVIVVALLVQKINAGVWITAKAMSVLLAFFCFWLWIFVSGIGTEMDYIRMRLFSSQTQFSLGHLSGIAVDDESRIYLAVQTYSRIQVYNKKGDFVKGWFVEAGGGIFDVWVEGKDSIHVVTSRMRTHDVFDSSGRLLKSIKVTSNEESSALFKKAGGLKTKDFSGNTYSILSPEWFPRIVKLTSDGKYSVVIEDPFYLWLVKTPLPIFLVFATSLIMLTVLGKVIKKKVCFPQIDGGKKGSGAIKGQ